jgi:hypothetical protein
LPRGFAWLGPSEEVLFAIRVLTALTSCNVHAKISTDGKGFVLETTELGLNHREAHDIIGRPLSPYTTGIPHPPKQTTLNEYLDKSLEPLKQYAKLHMQFSISMLALVGIRAPCSSAPATAVITGEGMTNAAIMRAFFTGQKVAATETNIAAMRWYLQIARDALERYKAMKYTGPGVATQTHRIQEILKQFAKWGVGE